MARQPGGPDSNIYRRFQGRAGGRNPADFSKIACFPQEMNYPSCNV